MMIENNQPTTAQSQPLAIHGISLGTMLTVSLVVLLIGGGGVYALMPKAVPPPTAEEIMATLAPDEAKVRKTYAELVKRGKYEDAKLYAKGVEITRAEDKLPPIAFALTAVEAMHDEAPPTKTAKAEETTEGNVQSPPLD